ncbi:MAG: hypothetical protein RLZZ423_208 [Cyanobacteriota bacterium]
MSGPDDHGVPAGAEPLQGDGPSRARLEQAARLQRQGCWLEAAAIYGALASQHPGDHRLRANQGNALWLADLPEAGAEAYRRSLRIAPDSSVSLRGLASCLRDLNRWPEALRARQMVADRLPPGSPEQAGNLWSTSQLLVGAQRWPEAFAAMAQRHHPPGAPPLDLLQPRLALESEQGYGDTFQFLRFLVDLVQRRHAAGQHEPVDLWVEPNLVELLQQGLAWLPSPPCLHGAASGAEAPLDPERLRPTLLDLPHHLGIAAIRPPGAYLRSTLWPSRERRRHGERPGLVGLCWAAGRKLDDPFTAREYHKRSLPPALLWRLVEALTQRGAGVVSLQVGDDADSAEALGCALTPPPEPIASFLGTARVLQQLDLLISVDTAIAHLAGALDRPAWILLPWSADPRWLESGSHTPWYGSLRLFRQPRSGDWHGAIDGLLEAWDAGLAQGSMHD